jgi:hypothetical protein
VYKTNKTSGKNHSLATPLPNLTSNSAISSLLYNILKLCKQSPTPRLFEINHGDATFSAKYTAILQTESAAYIPGPMLPINQYNGFHGNGYLSLAHLGEPRETGTPAGMCVRLSGISAIRNPTDVWQVNSWSPVNSNACSLVSVQMCSY